MNNNIFRHKGWMSTVTYYCGLFSIFALFYNDKLTYLPYVLILYLIASLTLSVGYHRLFCHGSFKCSKLWHKVFALSGIMFMYSSPLQWVVTHHAHHKNSDTEYDPHPKKYISLFTKSYRNVPLSLWKAKKLLRSDFIHKLVDKYYVILFVLFLSILALINLDLVLYIYLPSVGLAHLVGSIHHTFSHSNKSPQNLWGLEYLLCASGEWLHKTHHDHPGRYDFRTRWYHLDMGAMFINLIKR